MKFYILVYAAIGFGFFLGNGLAETFETRDRFTVAMSTKEVFALAIKHLVLSLLFWPLAIWGKYRTNWWRQT